MASPVETVTHMTEQHQPLPPVTIIEKDTFAPVAARCDVVQPTGEFDSHGARHAAMVESGPKQGKRYRLGVLAFVRKDS